MMDEKLTEFINLDLANNFNDLTVSWHKEMVGLDVPEKGDLEEYLKLVHFFNFSLWHEEDEARRLDVSDKVIAQVKRNIDGFNQKRNDMIQRIDESLVHLMAQSEIDLEKGQLNSETIGSMCDRISIMSLKVYHMNEIAVDVRESELLREQCSQKVIKLKEQQMDLEFCRKNLMKDIQSGKRRFKVYFQFKMYNDPKLNKAVKASKV